MGKKPLALIPPEFPDDLLYLWEWFIDLHGARGQGYSGPPPISFSEIKSWCDLMSITLSGWEVDLIKDLDKTYMRVVSNVRH